MKSATALILLIALAGCGEVGTHAYQLVASSDGFVYRLNTKTGEIGIIEKDRIRAIKEINISPLTIGGFYKDEKGTVIKYVGDQKFAKGDFSYLWK